MTKEEQDDSLHEAEELPAGETKDFHRGYQLVVMNLPRKIGEQPESTLHSNPSLDEQEGDQPSNVHEKSHPNFPYGKCNQNVENYVSDVFEGNLSIPIYDECKDDHMDDAPQEPATYKNKSDHL